MKQDILYIDIREDISFISMFEQYFRVRRKELPVGDYQYNNILIEHKNRDFVTSIRSGLLFKQVNDMLYNPLYIPYIIVSERISILERMDYGMSEAQLLAAIASIYTRGIPVIFLENKDQFVKYVFYLFSKHNDSKNRNVIPDRVPVSLQDKVQNHYNSIPSVGPSLSKRLEQKFPIPYDLYSASQEEIQTIPNIGTKIATKIWNFIHGVV